MRPNRRHRGEPAPWQPTTSIGGAANETSAARPTARARTGAPATASGDGTARRAMLLGGPKDHAGCWFWVPRRVSGRSQPARFGGVKPDGAGPQQQRCGLIPPNRAGSVYGDDAARDPEPGDHKQRPPPHNATQATADRKPNSRGPPPNNPTRGSPPRRGGPPEASRHPPNAADSRPHDVCAVTRTHARSCTRKPPPANAPYTDSDQRAVVDANTSGRQRDAFRSTELRPPARSSNRARSRQKTPVKPQTSRTQEHSKTRPETARPGPLTSIQRDPAQHIPLSAPRSAHPAQDTPLNTLNTPHHPPKPPKKPAPPA